MTPERKELVQHYMEKLENKYESSDMDDLTYAGYLNDVIDYMLNDGDMLP